MKSITSIIALAVAVPAALGAVLSRADPFTIDTPTSAVQCEPVLILWSGGVAPFFLDVIPGGEPNAAPLEDLGTQEGHSFTWLVDLAAGTEVGFEIRDSTGAIAQTAAFAIQSSSDSSCLSS